MSTSIRKQLGPVRKRLTDRIKEANTIIDEKENVNLLGVKTKLIANNHSHEILIEKLSKVEPVTDDERTIIDNEIEKCMELSMDAKEMLQTLSECIKDEDDDEVKNKQVAKAMQNEKLAREIEKLKVETEYKQLEVIKLKEIKAPNSNPDVKNKARTAKLPRLELPKFSGDITAWPSFWDQYASMVHNNDEISKIDKFKYLVSCLEDNASDTLQGFSMTATQYDLAIDHLKERFEDKEYIIHRYYEQLSELQKSRDNTEDLRYTFNILETK